MFAYTSNMKIDAIKKIMKDIGIIMQVCILIPIFCIYLVNFTIFNTGKAIDKITDQYCCSTISMGDKQAVRKSSVKNNIISSFSTDYSASPQSRKHNIRLALESLNNVVVHPNEELSFNQVVGKRTEERGYQKALVIFNGSYTEGVGGGVCQVSSTLYNAWLLAGLDVVSVRAHTLPSSYVDLSRDATVSEWIDLVLKNSTKSDICIKTAYTADNITISIEGEKREYKYSLKTEVLKTIPPEEDVFELDEFGDSEFYEGKNGYKSRLILTISNGNRIIAKREIRRDFYKPQNSVKILRKSILN